MHTVQSSLYALVLTACVLCLVIARGANAGRAATLGDSNTRLTFFLAFLVLQALGFTFEWLMLHPTTPGKSLWLGLLMVTSFFIAPCAWLFAREITENKTPLLRSLYAGHLMVIVIGIVFTLPLLQGIHWGPELVNPERPSSELRRLIVSSTMLVAVILFLLQAPYYVALCIRILKQNTDHAKVLFSNLEAKSFNTLRILILIVCMHWLVSFLRAVHCMTLGADTGLGVYFALAQVAFTLWALMTVIRQTTVFDVEDRKLIAGLGEANQTSDSDASAIYSKSSLDAAARERIARKLTAALLDEQLYRDSSINLRRLCAAISENPHYVSQVISQELNTSFYELINGARIDYAKQALLAAPEKGILDIALDAGFNSKSTFNGAFRRHAGTTPSEFRRTQPPKASFPTGLDAP